MAYYNSCVYAASGRKLDENKITVSDAELEKVQIDGLVAHLSDDHSLCWDEVCWRKENPDIQLKKPHLKEYTVGQKEKFCQFLKECFYISTKQSLITHIRTSYNEAFNRVKLCFHDKKIDYWKTYSTRHALAVLQYNSGLLNMLKIARSACNLQEFSEIDKQNISQIAEGRKKQSQRNSNNIAKRNEERGKKIQEQRTNLETFDWDKVYFKIGIYINNC